MSRVTLAGEELVGLERGDPGASVRLLLPRSDGLDLPEWNGNELVHADGTRARLRTLTPLAVRDDGATAQLDVDVVLHGDSPLTRWVLDTAVGDEVAVSGTGSGYRIDPTVSSYLLLGDESAVPAIATLLEELPAAASVQVHLERREDAEPVDMPNHPGAMIHWSVLPAAAPPGDTSVAAAVAADLDSATRIWVAGEAAAVQRIRKLLFDERDVPRAHAVIRGYWKAGRAGT
jgi:NADPH-dependent ferric siderophore reductase